MFEPQDFIARLAALVPRPHVHLVRYHRLFALNARHRHLIVLRHTSPISTEKSDNTSVAPTAPMTWMARLQRVFDTDISVCPNCGGPLRVIGEVTEPEAIARTAGVARKPIPPPARSTEALALSLTAGLVRWTVWSDFYLMVCRATSRGRVSLHQHSLHSA